MLWPFPDILHKKMVLLSLYIIINKTPLVVEKVHRLVGVIDRGANYRATTTGSRECDE